MSIYVIGDTFKTDSTVSTISVLHFEYYSLHGPKTYTSRAVLLPVTG